MDRFIGVSPTDGCRGIAFLLVPRLDGVNAVHYKLASMVPFNSRNAFTNACGFTGSKKEWWVVLPPKSNHNFLFIMI